MVNKNRDIKSKNEEEEEITTRSTGWLGQHFSFSVDFVNGSDVRCPLYLLLLLKP